MKLKIMWILNADIYIVLRPGQSWDFFFVRHHGNFVNQTDQFQFGNPLSKTWTIPSVRMLAKLRIFSLDVFKDRILICLFFTSILSNSWKCLTILEFLFEYSDLLRALNLSFWNSSWFWNISCAFNSTWLSFLFFGRFILCFSFGPICSISFILKEK